jgi:hypothetical protein
MLLSQVTTMPTSGPTSQPFSLPVDMEGVSAALDDPFVRTIVYGGAALVGLVIVLWWLGRRRENRRAARARADLRAGMAEVQMKQAEIRALGEKIIATSSTGEIAGFTLVRQIEAVFSDGEKSADMAVDLVKARAVRKGANAVIHLQTRQTPSGKWAASGDAVVVEGQKGSRDQGIEGSRGSDGAT